jgi:arylsulfatase A-like enzyme
MPSEQPSPTSPPRQRVWRERAGLLAPLLLAACGHAAGGASEHRPNIALIVIDTARADHFSCYGYAQRTTPNVDALAARGILFRGVHSVAPWTLPAHMSMFTGLVPRDHGASWAAFSEPETATVGELVDRAFTPSEPERMLAARLRAAGYRSYGFSPNPWISRNKGFAEGFDEFFELWREEEREAALGRKPAGPLEKSPTRAAVAGIERVLGGHPAGEPFFLFVNFIDPHFPYDPQEPFRTRFGGKPETLQEIQRGALRHELAMIAGDSPFDSQELVPFYDGELATADHAVGELVRFLESSGLFDDTLIVVTSDHGELLGEQGRWSHQLYVDEPLMNVPLVLKLPRGARAGTAVDAPLASNLDVYATVLAAAGAPIPLEDELSRDLVQENPAPREHLVGEYAPSKAYLRQLRKRNGAFVVEDHAHGRYVVYTSEFRTEIVGSRALQSTSLRGGADEARLAQASRAAEQALAAYLAARDESRSVGVGVEAGDERTRSELEALGYVGEEEPQDPTPKRKPKPSGGKRRE